MQQLDLWHSDPVAWLNLQEADPSTLRPYQERTIESYHRALDKGARAPIIVLPTGGGKTRVAADLIRQETKLGRPSLFLAPRRELVYQASRALSGCGVPHGIVMAGRRDLEDKYASCQVASIDTIHARRRNGSLSLTQRFPLIIVDEAHLSITTKKIQLLESWEDAVVCGLTATPSRKDGRALGLLYDEMIEEATTASLTDQGYLCEARYFSLSEPDLRRVRTVAGDYNQKDLAKVMNSGELVGDIVEHWFRLAAERRTVVFASSIAHSMALAEEFKRQGARAEHVDADTDPAERTETFKRFSDGDTQILCNCFLAAYGFDLPELDCVVLARPTKSLVLYLQSLGRGLRISEGKEDCLILDHSGAVHRFGFATDERIWSLTGKVSWDGSLRKGMKHASRTIKCPECAAMFKSAPKCPECGYAPKAKAQKVHTLDGDLVEIQRRKELIRKASEEQKFFRELMHYGRRHSYKRGWSSFKFKERYGRWPPRSWEGMSPLPPSKETSGWIRSRQIAWAKSQAKKRSA